MIPGTFLERILPAEPGGTVNWADPTCKVRWYKHDVYGDAVYGGLRTIAHLDWTNQQALKQFGHEVEVLQGAFNTDVEASAGTHDFDGCIDFFIPQVDWWDQQRFFRSCGWACWYRYPPLFGRHVHGVSLGCPGRLGVYVPGQITDYRAHAFGLANQHTPGSDHSWFPPDIDSTIFDYPAWRRDQEDDMGYRDWPKADQQAMAKDVAGEVVQQLLAATVDKAGTTVKAALRQGGGPSSWVRKLAAALGKPIDAQPGKGDE